jgi:hypothetical protein
MKLAASAGPMRAGLSLASRIRGEHTKSAVISAVLITLLLAGTALAGPAQPPFLPAQGSTSPANGDLNPYGLAVVPSNFPGRTLTPGQLLVSNFNNSEAGGNLQGQGTTIVIVDPNSAQQPGVFFQGASPIGFTNALSIVKAGFVFAGSVFTTLPDASDPTPGPLLVLDKNGNQVDAITTGTNGPWGLAVNDQGNTAQLFISNVFDGTVTRLNVSFKKGSFSVVGSPTTIASGYSFGLDDAGLVVGPAGLAYDSQADRLYVASEDDNEIFVITKASTRTSDAGVGTLVFSDPHLEGPLGLIFVPNGDLITANADPAAHSDPNNPSALVEFTNKGAFVRAFSIDSQEGGAFALLNLSSKGANQFAYVDDVLSNISIWRLSPQ